VKVTIARLSTTDDSYDVALDVTVTRRRVGRAPASTQTVSIIAWQGAGFVGGRVWRSTADTTVVEDISLRAVVTRIVCAQLYLRDLADCPCADIPTFSEARMRRLCAALENIQTFKRAFAGVPLPRLPQGR